MRRTALSWIVLVASLALTVFATWSVAESVDERDEVRFDNAVQTAHDRIRTRMQTYLALLRGGTGFFAASRGNVTLQEFHDYMERIDIPNRYPGIQGIGFSLRIPESSRDSVVAAMQAQGFPTFHIWPASQERERHSIVYLEPQDTRNAEAMGYDMYSNPVRREAMAQAWANGEPAMSGIVHLVQETEGPRQNGFLIYAPVYRGGRIPESATDRQNELIGFVYSAFRAGDLFNGIFGTERNPRVAFRIYDGTRVDSTRLLLDSDSVGIAPTVPSKFFDTRQLTTANRVWTIAFTETEHFASTLQQGLIPLMAFAGLAISFILFALVRSQVRTDVLVRRSEQRLRATLESLPVGVFVADRNGEITFANSAVSRIWRDQGNLHARLREGFKGWWPDTGVALRPSDWGLARALKGEAVPGQLVEIEAFDGEHRMILNSAFPVRSPSGDLEMAVAVAIDITEQKRAEAALRERNREFSLMANSIPQLAWMADETGAMFWFNERWYTYTGTKPSTAKGWEWAKLQHPDHADRVLARMKHSFETGAEWEDTFPLRGRDGSYRWFLSRAVPFRDENGRVIRWFGTNTDVTDQMRAQETEARALREQAARE
ncbi:MAG TPA: CHASE domain-containing protein, partial [Rhodothermales bacterium]